MVKFNRLAKKNDVEIIGQVTGSNGKLLQEAAILFSENNFTINPYKTLSINTIEKNGLTKNGIGRVIVF